MGWGHELRPDHFVVADDDLASPGWEQDLFRLAAGDVSVDFISVDDARGRIAEWSGDDGRTILLTRAVSSMAALARDGVLAGVQVNIGGVHPHEDRIELVHYVHLGSSDRAALRALIEAGVDIYAAELPDSPRVSTESLRARLERLDA